MKSSHVILSFAAAASLGTAAAGAAPLPRANIVLASATAVDLSANTVTLPLHRGSAAGAPVWYILTDTSDGATAKRLGLLFSPLIATAGDAIETVAGTPASLRFRGTVDFRPSRVLRVDAHGAPTLARPGSVGDAQYSPLVRIGSSGPVYNAPIVASGTAPHDIAGHTDTLDRVVAIDTRDAAHASVTLALARGFTNGEPIAYISTDASVDAPAAIERSTYAPRLKRIAAGTIPIDVLFNGRQQGIPFAGLHGHLGANATAGNVASIGSPLNVQATFPAAGVAASGYSPLWAVFAGTWTPAALAGGRATVLRSTAEVEQAASAGLLTSPNGSAFGKAGISVNCPVVAFAAKRP